jgi:hypothetical protein
MGRSKFKGDSSPVTSKYSINSKKSLYDDDDSDEGEDELSAINAIKTLVGINKNVRDNDTNDDDSAVNKAKKLKTTDENNDSVPDFIGSNQEKIQPNRVPLSLNTNHNEDAKLNPQLKALLINAIRTLVFRKIKFLNNEKLGAESNVFRELYRAAGLNCKIEQRHKYEVIRTLVQRQMNSKRNYCTDQIMAKARGTYANCITFEIFVQNSSLL